jgi:glycerol-3-phosphate dehydrogenase subunit C
MRRCKAVSEAMFDPFEYFVMRDKDGLLKTDFKVPLGKDFLPHVPCHSRVQNVGKQDRGDAQDDRRTR